jgi:tRNA A-37 threonylcarbamoyl transferase component Bud32
LIWHVHPDATGLFDCPPPVAGWIESGLAERVKANDQRTVWRVNLPSGVVFVKRCRVHRPRAWVRDLVRSPKARLEFEHALELRDRGIDVVEPLAWARTAGRWPGDSWIVTRGRDAIPFSDWINRPFSPTDRQELARAIARFFARLHDAGVIHPDPHPGNLLVETDSEGAPRFVLIDLHAVSPGKPASVNAAFANLVLFNRWFRLRATRSDRLRFWLDYVRERTTLTRPDAKRIEVATARSNNRFWARRFARYTTDNREFVRVLGPAARGYAVRTLVHSFVDTFLADPEAAFRDSGTNVLKDSRTSTVVELTVDDCPMIFKRFNWKSLGTVLKNAVRPSPATRSWLLGHNLRDRGLPTPRPLLLAHRYRFGIPAVSYLLVEKVPAAVELATAVMPANVSPLAAELGRLVRTMHDRHVSHRDLKAANILLEFGLAPTLIDLVGVRIGPVPFPTRVRDLARLNASFLNSPVVSRTDRLRALTAYLGVPPRDGKDWKAWWAAVDAATRAKVAKNRRTGRPLA